VSGAWPWLALTAAGAFHGLNPAMGWLFAVGLGMQERSHLALLRALPFIALGHALSIGLVVVCIGVLGLLVDPRAVQLGCAGLLVGFGTWKAIRWRRHPRWVGMRVGPRALVAWSFLMATAHGAGLMLAPILLRVPASFAYLRIPNPHVLALGTALPSMSTAATAVLVHTGSMLAVATAVALVVYETVGVGILRRAWVNLDLPWAASLVGAGLLMAAL
jgi:hypothetical protein